VKVKTKLDWKEREKRVEARRKILHAANKAIVKGRRTVPLNARQIQRAVFVCRQRGLVKPDVLVAAGYNPE
jgi:hypothetical protein